MLYHTLEVVAWCILVPIGMLLFGVAMGRFCGFGDRAPVDGRSIGGGIPRHLGAAVWDDTQRKWIPAEGKKP